MWPTRIFFFFVFLGGAAIVGFPFLLSGAPVEFESRESRTVDEKPVFNRVRFQRVGLDDVWMMQQSHAGRVAAHESWDRLAIVVSGAARSARFYQLPPGPLGWTGAARELPFKVNCALCHSNGPRAVRPAPSGLSVTERARVFAWNLRIKSYGVLKPDPAMADAGHKFLAREWPLNEPLRVKTCVRCHNEKTSLSRGTLTRQQFLPIRYLVAQGQMPPPGFSLSSTERAELEKFLEGMPCGATSSPLPLRRPPSRW